MTLQAWPPQPRCATVGSGKLAGQKFRAMRRDQHVVGGGDEQGRAGRAGPKLERPQRRRSSLDGRDRREALELVLRLEVEHPRISRAPAGRVEEDRLGVDIGLRAALPEQLEARVEASRDVRIEPRPAVDDDPLGQSASELQPDQPADRVAEESGPVDARARPSRRGRPRPSRRSTSGRREARRSGRCRDGRRAIPDGLRQRGQIGRPIRARAAQAGREDQDRAVVRTVKFIPEARGVRHQPICATLAISTSSPGFTRPHWMQ